MNLFKTLLFLTTAGVVGAVHAAAPAGNAAGDAAAGQTKAVVCAACHGEDGNSTLDANPKLAGQGAVYLAKQLRDFRSGARANPIMMGMAAPLSDQDILDLAAWFSSRKNTTESADPELVKTGERLWRGGNLQTGVLACTGCHGPSGRGNVPAGFPALRGQHAAYIEAQLRAFRAAAREDSTGDRRANDPEGMMRGAARYLSDAEIQAVSQFVSGLYQ